MLRSAAAFASLALLTGSLFAVNTAPAPRLTDRPIPELVRDLGSPDYAEREAASRDIDRIGPPALFDLKREIAKSTDGEVLRRGRQLIARLEKRLADEKALAPTMVEINADGQTIEQIVADLSKQTGYAVSVTADESKRVTLKTGRITFWQAIDQLCDAGNLQIAAVGGIKAPGTKIADASSPREEITLVPQLPVPLAADPLKAAAAKVEELKKDLEKVAKARAEVAKEVKGAERAAALAKIQAEAELKLAEAQREMALKKAGVAAKPVLPPAMNWQPGQGTRAPKEAWGSERISALNGIVLEPRQGAKRPSANFGAVRLEAMAMPANAAVPDAVAALVQVWAEPRLQWQQTRSVRVRTARDDQGQALVADPSSTIASGPLVLNGNGIQMVQNVNGGVVIVNNGGGQVIINGNINGRVIVNNGNVVIQGNDFTAPAGPSGAFTPNPRQVVVKLQPGEKSTDALKEFAGILEAVVRTGPEAIVTIGDLTKPIEQSHPGGVRLKTGELTKGEDGNYTLDVELEYDPNSVQLAAPPGERNVGAAAPDPFQGRIMIRGGRRVNSGTSGRVVFGLHVTDEAGKPYTIQAQQQSVQFNGVSSAMKLTLSLVPESKDQPAPKSIAFWGTRNAGVDVPFKLEGVPTLAATK